MIHVEQANDLQAKLYGQRIDGQLEKAWEALAEIQFWPSFFHCDVFDSGKVVKL